MNCLSHSSKQSCRTAWSIQSFSSHLGWNISYCFPNARLRTVRTWVAVMWGQFRLALGLLSFAKRKAHCMWSLAQGRWGTWGGHTASVRAPQPVRTCMSEKNKWFLSRGVFCHIMWHCMTLFCCHCFVMLLHDTVVALADCCREEQQLSSFHGSGNRAKRNETTCLRPRSCKRYRNTGSVRPEPPRLTTLPPSRGSTRAFKPKQQVLIN